MSPEEEREGKAEDQDFRVRLIRVWNGADSVSGCVENVLEAFTLEMFGAEVFDPGEMRRMLTSGADRAEMLAMELRVLADERPK